MPYRKRSSRQYSPIRRKTHERKAKPIKRSVKLSGKQIEAAFGLKPVGAWGKDLFNSETGKYLRKKHMENVKEILKKEKIESKADMERVMKKVMETPQQKLLVYYEVSLRRPLEPNEFIEYLELFKVNFPRHYKSLYGSKSPRQVAAESMQDWRRVQAKMQAK